MKQSTTEIMEHSRQVLIDLAVYLVEGTTPNYNKQEILLAIADGETALKTIIDMYEAGFISEDTTKRSKKNV